MKSGFDQHVKEVLRKDKKFARAYWKEFAKEPIWTQIAILRRKHNLSQQALAKRLHVPQPQVARLERRGYYPSVSTLERLAKVFHCHLTFLPDEALAASR